MRPVAASWQVIRDVLRERAPAVHFALQPPASASAIAELQAVVGFALPDDLKASLAIHDGIDRESTLVDYYSPLPAAEILSWWRMSCEVQLDYGFGGNTLTTTPQIRADLGWREKWLPIMATASGDLMVLDLDPGPSGHAGQIITWYNNSCSPMRVLADSYAAWLDAVAEELAGGRFDVDADIDCVVLQKPWTYDF